GRTCAVRCRGCASRTDRANSAGPRERLAIHLNGCQDIAIRDHGAGHPGLCVCPEIVATEAISEHLRLTGRLAERWNVHQQKCSLGEADEQFALLLLLGWIEQTRR